VVEYILTNKEWIFSGAGVSAMLIAGGWLFNRQRPVSPPAPSGNPSSVRVELVHSQPTTKNAIQPKSEVAGIVKRFNQILTLMNEKRSYGKYTIASLAQLMKLHSVGELESVFLGNREPSFDFIDHFCACFGVNRDWLIEGKSNPFRSSEKTNYDPLEYLSEIENINPERIYFIRSESAIGEVFILLKLADWKYKIVSRVWHISDHVGAGGQSQIFGLYKLILALQKSPHRLNCGGRILREADFDNLLSGNAFPGSIIEFPNQENPWWDDFIDVHHTYPISSSYESWYGKGFMEAQSTVRSKLRNMAEREG
jgi:transcriptional regulator with XRE-family HTH domain